MKTKPKVLVLGNFGYANHDLNGQTVKTRVTYELFEKYYPHERVEYFDTQTLCNRIKIFSLLRKVASCDKLVYLPAHGNLKYLFPLYFIMSYVFRFDIIYSVIGGWLVPYLKTKPMHRWMLKRIRVVLAETTRMKIDLENCYGFKNVDVLYNFRMSEYKPEIRSHNTLKLVFMARVDPNKGLDTIFALCDVIKNTTPHMDITMDFYGPFTQNLNKEEFLSKIDEYDFVSYHGVLEPDSIYESISDYDLLLLPTHYYTEGLPGTIIDSYMVGVPPVVSDWMHAREFVENNVSGIIVPFENHIEDFVHAIFDMYYDRKKLYEMKTGAIKQSQRFSSTYAWNRISKYILD